ncbi:MAG: hypothetical protein J5685_04615 [Clostridiales bacterium]|nr:hypothetical protein [Clostridiales bacterium]
MSKLCLGTFFTAIVLCADDASFKQGEDFCDVFGLLDNTYNPSPDIISKFVRGERGPKKTFIAKINKYDPDQFGELCYCMHDLSNKISSANQTKLVKILKKIILDDNQIESDAIVDLVNNTTKQCFPGEYETFSSLLTGVFLYVVKYAHNDHVQTEVKKLDEHFLAELLLDDKTKAESTNTSTGKGGLSEDDIISAQMFLLCHEYERTLMPLCQIAYLYNPDHNHLRDMYTEYSIMPERIRRHIMDKCQTPELMQIDKLHWKEGLDALKSDLKEYDLASARYQNKLSEYFLKVRYNLEWDITHYTTTSFERCFVPDLISLFPASHKCNMWMYISDYLYLNGRGEAKDVKKPFDYLWSEKGFAYCSNEDLSFWLCIFILAACNNLSDKIIKDKIFILDYHEDDATTLEDMYFSTLLALHQHYLFHEEARKLQENNIRS